MTQTITRSRVTIVSMAQQSYFKGRNFRDFRDFGPISRKLMSEKEVNEKFAKVIFAKNKLL